MKRRIDADITTVNEDANYKDYSRPRMVMRSGHDSTVSADLIFLIKALGLNESDIYDFPKYASQLAIEVRSYKTTKSSYSDYNVVGFFDDRQIFNVTADKFISGIESEAWSEAKVNEFCGFDDESSSSSTNANSTTNNQNDDDDHSDNAKTAYKVLMSVFICLAAIFLATTIYLAYKLSKLKKQIPNFDGNKSAVTDASMQNN